MISVVLLAHNDGRTLERTLNSVAWSKDIVVIDDYSRDHTPQIAKRYGAVVFRRPLNNDFAAQRNFGLSKARCTWVLFVDSDEIVTDSLRYEIEKAVEKGSANGYFIRRQDSLFGRVLRYGETANIRLLRLAKKRAGEWRRPIHEVWEVKGETGMLQAPLIHLPHPDVAQFISDINRYSTVNAAYLYTSGVRAPGWHVAAYPAAKFVVDYVLYLGFLDGMPGAIMAIMMSFHSFLTRAKLYMLWDKSQRHTE